MVRPNHSGYRRLMSVRGVVNLLCDSNDSGGGIPFRKRFPNEQAAISIADPLPEKEKKNEGKKERGIEQLSARFALRSVVLVIPR